MSSQRNKHKTKELIQDRVAKLNDIGFVWNAARQEVYNERWNEMFKDLVDYKEKVSIFVCIYALIDLNEIPLIFHLPLCL